MTNSFVRIGCAFVTFSSNSPGAPDAAIERLHGKKLDVLSPGPPLQIKIADAKERRAAGDYKLFIGMIPKSLNEEQLQGMFGVFGEISEVFVEKELASVFYVLFLKGGRLAGWMFMGPRVSAGSVA